MEQLMKVNDTLFTISRDEIQYQICRVSMKIKINLSKDQLVTLHRLLFAYMSSTRACTLEEKALYSGAFDLWENKVRKRLISRKTKNRLTFSIQESWILTTILGSLRFPDNPYEQHLQWYIISTIDQQIA